MLPGIAAAAPPDATALAAAAAARTSSIDSSVGSAGALPPTSPARARTHKFMTIT